MKQVSVLLTVFNGEEKIKKCLESLIRQDYEHIQFVVFDDGSTDGTRKVIRQTISENSSVNFIFESVDRNIGRSEALNRCLAIATGDYIAIMDADDEMFPNRITLQVEYLIKNSTVAVVGGAQLMHLADGSTKINRPPLSDRSIKAGLFVRTTLLHPTVMFRKSFLDFHKIKYNRKYYLCEDYKIFSDMYFSGANFANIPEVVNTYDYTKAKSWDGHQEEMIAALRLIWSKNLKYISVADKEEYMQCLLKLTGKIKIYKLSDLISVVRFFLVCVFCTRSMFGGVIAFTCARINDARIMLSKILSLMCSRAND